MVKVPITDIPHKQPVQQGAPGGFLNSEKIKNIWVWANFNSIKKAEYYLNITYLFLKQCGLILQSDTHHEDKP